MERFFLCVFFYSALVMCFIIPSVSAHFDHGLTNAGSSYSCSPAEQIALRSLLAHFPAGNFSNWRTSDDCCTWGPGITCSTASHNVPSMPTNKSSTASEWRSKGPVTGLVLDTTLGGSLTYPIPASLCNLSSLITLRLSSMFFVSQEQEGAGGLSGSIPHCIGIHLTNLVELDFQSNRLTGAIPDSFSHLHSLQSLDLSGNSLDGFLPHSFSLGLQSLRLLDLSENSLSGWLPPSFGLHFPNLTTLYLNINSFSGPLPSFSSPLLQSLDLSHNLFSGSIGNSALAPHSPFTSLSYLDLSYNYLSGGIPNFDPSDLPSLAHLDLSANLLDGSVPDSICGLTNLTFLGLSSNSLSGSLLLSRQCRKPMFAQGLTYLDVSYNEINGPFPNWIGSLTNLGSLDLSYNRALSGSLPNSWQNLSLLWQLDLSGISLVPPEGNSAPRLPSWCFLLPALQDLSIGSLRLQATDLHCSSLLLFLNSSHFQSLDLSYNHFNSDLLQCLSNLSKHFSLSPFDARRLILSENPLGLNINLPEAIQLLPPPFPELDMASCGLSGRLSGAFFDHIGPSVGVLSLANNDLEGQVPTHLGNLSRMVWLDLSSNHLEGQVPAELRNLGGQLYWLDLSHNYLAGFAPLGKQKLFSAGNWSNIKLSDNHLVGKLSLLLESIFDINACILSEGTGMFFILDVSTNLLTGSIPPWLRQCSLGARFLYLHNNRLEGSIPNELFQNNPLLQVLSLGNNQLTGQIPQSISILTNLWVLDLSHNRLTGSLETSSLFAGNASSNHQYMKLRVLLLGYNDFTGSVPPSLAVIAPALQVIDLSNNHLTGIVPVHTLHNFSAFRTIDTSLTARHDPIDTAKMHSFSEEFIITVKGNAESYEYLRGSIGEDVHEIPIASLDLSGNRMGGPLPVGLGELSGLAYLNLSRNKFSGPIPPDLGKLSGQLQALDLSYNELVGPIPASFHNLTGLEVFNVSYNPGLSGPIPQSQPQFETATSYIGDPNLCGDPVLHSCKAPEPATTSFPSRAADSGLSKKRNAFAEWVDEWVSIPGFCLGTVVSFVGILSVLAYFDPN